jgi:hypothetical protein
MSYDADSEALEKICGDMDDMESDKMFKKPEDEDKNKGVAITIEVEPKKDEPKSEPLAEAPAEDDEMKLPPFLRKKK